MNCERIQGLLSAYVDGQLAPNERLEAIRHACACPVCLRELTALEEAKALLGGPSGPAMPAHLRSSLEARLDEARVPSPGLRAWLEAFSRPALRWAAVGAAAAIIFFVLARVVPEPPGVPLSTLLAEHMSTARHSSALAGHEWTASPYRPNGIAGTGQ